MKEKKKNNKIKELKIPIYGGILEIIVDKNFINERIKRNHIFGEFDDNNFFPSAMFSYSINELRYALFFNKSATYEDIFHEVFHLTFRIMSNIGVDLDENTNEVFAYLHGWLGEEVINIINDNKSN